MGDETQQQRERRKSRQLALSRKFLTAASATAAAEAPSPSTIIRLEDGGSIEQCRPPSVLAWLMSLRIREEDARKYAEALLARGFDDVQSLQEVRQILKHVVHPDVSKYTVAIRSECDASRRSLQCLWAKLAEKFEICGELSVSVRWTSSVDTIALGRLCSILGV